MVEAMAAANAFLRLKTEDRSLSVSIIHAQWLLCDYPCKMHDTLKNNAYTVREILWGSSNK